MLCSLCVLGVKLFCLILQVLCLSLIPKRQKPNCFYFCLSCFSSHFFLVNAGPQTLTEISEYFHSVLCVLENNESPLPLNCILLCLLISVSSLIPFQILLASSFSLLADWWEIWWPILAKLRCFAQRPLQGFDAQTLL